MAEEIEAAVSSLRASVDRVYLMIREEYRGPAVDGPLGTPTVEVECEEIDIVLAALASLRAATVEECAKVAEARSAAYDRAADDASTCCRIEHLRSSQAEGKAIAAALRALIAPQKAAPDGK